MSVLERVRENQAIQGKGEPKGLRGTRLLSEMGPSVKEAVLERVGYEEAARIAGLSDPKRARSELRPAVDAVLNVLASDFQDGSDREELVAAVLDDIVGLGPLQPLLEDDSITEVMVNGPQAAFYERAGVLYPLERPFESEEQIRLVVDRIISPLGRRVDERSPMVNARLANGYRVNAVIPPIAIDGTLLTIRKFSDRISTLDELVAIGSLPAWYATLLSFAVRAREDLAVAGGTGSGKTTLLNALSSEIPISERILTIEDSAELQFSQHPHVVRLEARSSSIEGEGAVTIRDLVTNALRMRPDRIVVGEVRGAECIDMLQAMNTGHDGSLTTLLIRQFRIIAHLSGKMMPFRRHAAYRACPFAMIPSAFFRKRVYKSSKCGTFRAVGHLDR